MRRAFSGIEYFENELPYSSPLSEHDWCDRKNVHNGIEITGVLLFENSLDIENGGFLEKKHIFTEFALRSIQSFVLSGIGRG